MTTTFEVDQVTNSRGVESEVEKNNKMETNRRMSITDLRFVIHGRKHTHPSMIFVAELALGERVKMC